MRRSSFALLAIAACAGAPAVGPEAWFASNGMRIFARATCTLPTGEHTLAVGGEPAVAGCVSLFGPSGQLVATRQLGSDLLYAVATSPTGDCAVVGGASLDVHRLHLPDLVPTVRWRHAKPVVAVAIAADGRWLASGGHDGVVLVGSIDSGEPVTLEHSAAVLCVAIQPASELVLAGARDGTVRLHARSGRLLRSWNRLGGEVIAVAFRDGRPHAQVRRSPIDTAIEVVLDWP